jgi:two-component system, OmpR family, sensor histidine kinase CssS
MKNLPLAMKIWITLIIIIFLFSIVIGLLYSTTLRTYFTREIYNNIESAQDVLKKLQMRDLPIISQDPQIQMVMQDMRSVQHFILFSKKGSSPMGLDVVIKQFPVAVIEQIRQQALQQHKIQERYRLNIKESQIFYVIFKTRIKDQEAFVISYLWDTYKKALEVALFKRLLLWTSLALIGMLFLAIWFSNYLAKPLADLQKKVQSIARRDWDVPIKVDQNDEIGQLGRSIESLRQQLRDNDLSVQSSLQYISHELKTPVMIIRSYVQSIKDGIFPQGNFSKTADVIDQQAIRLEKRIQDLLYFTKIAYLKRYEISEKEIELNKLIKDVVQKLSYRRKELSWDLQLQSVRIKGDPDQWNVVIENLLDNQIRYAKEKIGIILKEKEQTFELEINDDGPGIEPAFLKDLFSPYQKGIQGKSGLGLAIVQRIIKLHGGQISVQNRYPGAKFTIEIPK